MSILCKFRQIWPFNRDFFEPLLIFCCNLSAWAQKWPRERSETLASIEICDKTTFFGRFSYKTSKFGPNSTNLDPFTLFFPNPSFFVVFYQAEHKNDKDHQQKRGKYRNSMQNNVLGSISIQNVQIWAKCRQIGVFHRVFFEPLLIFCCIPSGWARKWPRTSRYSLITTEICDKTTELLRFHSQSIQNVNSVQISSNWSV